MEYYALGLAALGAAFGTAFRWKVLLPIICLLPVAAIIFSISQGFGVLSTVIVVIAAEAFLQAGYFAGLSIRTIAARWVRSKGDL